MKDLNDVLREEGADGVRARMDAARPFKGNGADPGWRAHTTNAEALRTMEFPPVSYVLPGLIPEGLSILAGRPKVGKSWLALGLCLGVAGDCDILGGLHPTLGDVLYLALEDNLRRLRQRIRKIGTDWPERLTLATRWRRLDDGGVEDIADWASSVLCPRLVVMDTLAGVRPERQMRDTPYDGDYRALTEIHQLAGEKQMPLRFLHAKSRAP